ncbi:10680_t:CDS:2, partial [Diversispora eburnea]
MSQEKPSKKLSRSDRYNKKCRLNKEQNEHTPIIMLPIRLVTPDKSIAELVRFQYIVELECIIDTNGQTLIHLEKLNNSNAITETTDA